MLVLPLSALGSRLTESSAPIAALAAGRQPLRASLRASGSAREFQTMSPDSRAWRAADALMLLLFAFAAALQLNDPDPVRWFTVYALAAVACLLSLRRRLHWALPALLCAVALAWAATIAPRVVGRVPVRDMFGAWEMKNEGIEESREMYGLLIIAAWMAVLAVRARRAGRAASVTGGSA